MSHPRLPLHPCFRGCAQPDTIAADGASRLRSMIEYETLCQHIVDWREGKKPGAPPPLPGGVAAAPEPEPAYESYEEVQPEPMYEEVQSEVPHEAEAAVTHEELQTTGYEELDTTMEDALAQAPAEQPADEFAERPVD